MGLILLATLDSAVYFEYLSSDQVGYPLTLSVSRCGGRERKENFPSQKASGVAAAHI